MTTLAALTTDHLGDIATDQDLAEFKAWATELMDRDGLTEDEAIDALWSDGDYYSNAIKLGLVAG